MTIEEVRKDYDATMSAPSRDESMRRISCPEYTCRGYAYHGGGHGWTVHFATEIEALRAAYAYRTLKTKLDTSVNGMWGVNVVPKSEEDLFGNS